MAKTITLKSMLKTKEYQTLINKLCSLAKEGRAYQEAMYMIATNFGYYSALPALTLGHKSEWDEQITRVWRMLYTDLTSAEKDQLSELYYVMLRSLVDDVIPVVEKLSARNKCNAVSRVYGATCTGNYCGDEFMVLRKCSVSSVMYAMRNVPIKQLRMFLRYTTDCTFYWRLGQSKKVITEDTMKYFKAHEVPDGGQYWYMCGSLSSLAFNRKLLDYVMKDVLEATEVKNTPEHNSAAAGAARKVINKYEFLCQGVKHESITEYIRTAQDMDEAMNKLIILTRDTGKMRHKLRFQTQPQQFSIKELRDEHRRLIPYYNEAIEHDRLHNVALTKRTKEELSAPIDRTYEPKEMHTDTYDIIAPKTRDEIVDEGVAMHHCVASYAPYHGCISASDCMYIMFGRNKDGSRLVTIEVRYNLKAQKYVVLQTMKFGDHMDEQTRQIAHDYEAFLNVKEGE